MISTRYELRIGFCCLEEFSFIDGTEEFSSTVNLLNFTVKIFGVAAADITQQISRLHKPLRSADFIQLFYRFHSAVFDVVKESSWSNLRQHTAAHCCRTLAYLLCTVLSFFLFCTRMYVVHQWYCSKNING